MELNHVMIMGIIMVASKEAPICEIKEANETLPEIKPDLQAKAIPTEHEMTVFPNPFIKDLKVEFDFRKKDDYLFLMYDVKGQLLFAQSHHLAKGQQTIPLDIAAQNLADGVYILQILDNQDRILASKKVYKGQP